MRLRSLGRRLLSWARTGGKLVLLILCYFWVGAAYKLVYAQTHDLTRFERRIPLPYYQHQFALDSLLSQTWIFGPDFRDFLGELPSLGALTTSNPQAALSDYARQREQELLRLPARYPYSLFAEEALDDAYQYGQFGSVLGIVAARERPSHALAIQRPDGSWALGALPDLQHSRLAAQRLVDEYPDSPQAAAALLRVVRAEAQQSSAAAAREGYARIMREYPGSAEAIEAAEALYRLAEQEGRLEEMARYRAQALAISERRAREEYGSRALPARETVDILGFRVDLAGLVLRMDRPETAATQLAAAAYEVQRLRGFPSLEERIRRDFRESREELERVRSEAWLSELFKAVEVPYPGAPPRAREQVVTGRALLDGKPLPGVEVLLSTEPPRPGGRMRELLSSGVSGFRARTDTSGRFRVEGLVADTYHLSVAYPLEPEPGKGPIRPAESQESSSFAAPVEVADRPKRLPDLHFTRAVSPGTFGELTAERSAVRLRWRPWPSAARYRVEVSESGLLGRMNLYRNKPMSPEQRALYEQRRIFWTAETEATEVELPLLELSPDTPQLATVAQFEHRVVALGADGRELAASPEPLGRFHLHPSAVGQLLKLNPPLRGTRRGPGGAIRRRLGR
ncbi:MAG: hypothetical protein ACK47B_26900 [Armatimonadota bacterium]